MGKTCPELGLIFYCCPLGILDGFILEFVFCLRFDKTVLYARVPDHSICVQHAQVPVCTQSADLQCAEVQQGSNPIYLQ